MLAIVPDIQNHLILGGFLVGGEWDREGHKPIIRGDGTGRDTSLS